MADELDPAEILNNLAAEHDRRVRESERTQSQILRDEGVVGMVRASSLGDGFIAYGPDLYGTIFLFAMADGTVRWRKP